MRNLYRAFPGVSLEFSYFQLKVHYKALLIEKRTDLTLIATESALRMVDASFLNARTKRKYWQAYQGRLKQMMKD